jgi:hypothetical protein
VKCHRCNGIMANERFYGAGDPFWGWRCLLCGEILDPLIWENRNHCRKFLIVGKVEPQMGEREGGENSWTSR